MAAARNSHAAKSLGDRIRQRATDQGLRIEDLALGVAELLDEEPVTGTGFVMWLKQPERVRPDRVFAIERVLRVEPGTYSRELGYVPAELAPPPTRAEDCIERDASLDSQAARLLVAVISAFRTTRPEEPEDGSTPGLGPNGQA